MENKVKLYYSIYAFGVACILVLVAYTIYCHYAFWSGAWHGSYIYSFIILNTYTVAALGVGVIPMTIACVLVYKHSGVSKSKNKFWKFNLLFLPAYVCGISLLYLLFEIMLTYMMRHF